MLFCVAQEEDRGNRQTGDFDRLIHDPHVYETSSHAFRGITADRQDQTILVSGVSGAGKTETIKILMHQMQHLATHELMLDTITSGIRSCKDISESDPLFEVRNLV